MDIPLARPELTEKDSQAVLDVLNTTNISLGPKLEEFEEMLADYAGVDHSVAVNSGTSALHLIIKSLRIGTGDEVITTPFSFVATSNCILFEGAKPVFADIDPKTLNIDPEKVEEKITDYTKAIVAVDVFGQPADWSALEIIADDHELALVDDSAEALGAEFKGQKAGTFGDAGVFAFYPNKQITTGEGGAVVTDDEEIAKLARSYRNQGRGEGDSWLQHERIGYNYRISDINCALGISQLKRLGKILKKRARVAEMYNEKLKGIDEVRIPYISPEVKMSWFVYVVRLSEEFSREDRNEIIKGLSEDGVGASNYFAPIHLQPFYKKEFGYQTGDFPVAESVGDRTIALPFFNTLTEDEVEHVVSVLKEEISNLN